MAARSASGTDEGRKRHDHQATGCDGPIRRTARTKIPRNRLSALPLAPIAKSGRATFWCLAAKSRPATFSWLILNRVIVARTWPAAKTLVVGGVLAALGACRTPAPPTQRSSPPPDFAGLSARVDPYVPKSRVIVLTDIANEPDDQMSMVRFLVYANSYDVEGLVATTSTWMRARVRPDVIHQVIDAYARCSPTCSCTRTDFRPLTALRAVVVCRADGIRHGCGGTRTRCRPAPS